MPSAWGEALELRHLLFHGHRDAVRRAERRQVDSVPKFTFDHVAMSAADNKICSPEMKEILRNQYFFLDEIGDYMVTIWYVEQGRL